MPFIGRIVKLKGGRASTTLHGSNREPPPDPPSASKPAGPVLSEAAKAAKAQALRQR